MSLSENLSQPHMPSRRTFLGLSALAATAWPTWGIAAAAALGVVLRPFGWPEFIWAVAAAVLLVQPPHGL